MTQDVHRVVIVGGGAGGLELAANLGRRYGPRHVVLVDKADTHIWKPSLHEVAAGTLDIHREGLSYFMLAKDCGFTFVHGALQTLDRVGKRITIGPVHADTGDEVLPERVLPYETLVMAVGSKSNFFGTPGAEQHATSLDSTEQAEHFRLKLLHALSMANRNKSMGEGKPIDIAIVGGGATGVELAAELLEACASFIYYGFDTLDPLLDCRITLLEGADRILSSLPPKLSQAARTLLEARGVTVHTSVRVASVEETCLVDSEGRRFPADLCVWAAGIQAPRFLAELGLETNRIQQLVVDERLRTQDPDIFAIGDCAQAPWLGEDGYLPARAQVAHQQATFMLGVIKARIAGEPAPQAPFRFKDYGSLVSVGHSRGVGSLMGVLSGKSWFVEGLLARLMYMSLHLLHHKAVLGLVRTASLAFGRLLMKRGAPRVKLH